MIIPRRLGGPKNYHLNLHDSAKNLSWRFSSKYNNPVSAGKKKSISSTTALFLQFPILSKMQFKAIASILLLFVAQTMAKSCTSLLLM